MTKLLIVEDEPSVSGFISQSLIESGYSVDVAENGADALKMASGEAYSLIVLDLMLPDVSGLEVLKTLRDQESRVPVLVLTAKAGVDDRVTGLNEGADDYLTKPFAIQELTARIDALLRRSSSEMRKLKVADLEIDPLSRHASRGDRTIYLSDTEFRLLYYLMRNAGHVLSKDQILEHVWHDAEGGNPNSVEVYINYLRKKTEFQELGRLIHTVRGVGYVCELREEAKS